MSTTDRGTYQMLWDCPYCGSEKLLGLDHRHCPTCGAPQDPARRYFPSEADKIAVVDHRFSGADRVCPSCQTPNAATCEFCGNCGTPLSEAAEAKKRAAQEAGGAGFAADDAKAAEAELRGGKPPPPPPPPKKNPLKYAIFGCLGLGFVLLLVVALVAAFWKKDASLEVTGHSWSRTIQIETYKSVRESDWEDQVPRGATNVSCTQEVRSHEKIADGETCTTKRVDQGDGTYREEEVCKTKYRSEPVYDDKCSYNIDKWVNGRKAEASGTSVKDSPRWPSSGVRGGSGLGAEREGPKTEAYTLALKESKGGKKHSCNLSQDRWSKAAVGSKWKGKVRVMTGGLDCDSLKPK